MGPDFQLVSMTAGAVAVGIAAAVSCVLWIGKRFDEHEQIADQRHLENISKFSDLTMQLALIKQEMRFNRDDK